MTTMNLILSFSRTVKMTFDSFSSRWWITLICGICLCMDWVKCEQYKLHSYTAHVNITYRDPVTGQMRSEKEESGMYGMASRLDPEHGYVVHVRSEDNQSHGCTPPVNVPSVRWIALIERGVCKFHKKIYNSAVLRNASAVVIYNNEDQADLLSMDHKGLDVGIVSAFSVDRSTLTGTVSKDCIDYVDDVVSIFMSKADGEKIARLVDNGTKVMMRITLGRQVPGYSNINKTSVLFVSISFIVLMIISLAWLVFYYIQRFRYAHAKERLSKRLMNAAKKAITKMPLRTVKNGDKETESDFDQCAVCIEGYRASEVIRVLPCKHMFHKSCVDPWLIEQRSCPMCKMDILKAYGLQIHGSHDSVANVDLEGASTSLGQSETVAGHMEEGAVGGVEVVQYQPAQVEYHETPADMVSDDEGPERATKRNKVAPAVSMESVRSQDSDSNELQKLMPILHRDSNGTRRESESS